MARPYHSASSVKTGERCERAWFYTYVMGMRPPEVPWEDIEKGYVATAGQRALALGKAVHAVGEAFFSGGEVQWGRGLPELIYASGVHLLPSPSECDVRFPEAWIGEVSSGFKPEDNKPMWYMPSYSVNWAGARDLLVRVPDPEVLKRIAWPSELEDPQGWLLVDYKTTSNIRRWPMSPEALKDDLACCLYAVDSMYRRHSVDRLEYPTVSPPEWQACRWLYMESKDIRRALPVDLVVHRDHAYDVILEGSRRAIHLDTIQTYEDAQPNPAACEDYGGCPFHTTLGGPCTVRKSWGAILQSDSKTQRRNVVAELSPEAQAEFNNFRARPAAATVPAVVNTQPPSSAETLPDEGDGSNEAAAPEAPKPKRGRKPAAREVEPAVVEPEPVSLASLQIELDHNLVRLQEAKSAVSNTLTKIQELAGI